MRVLTCLIYEHDYRFVLTAALMCAIGAWVSVRLWERTFAADEGGRLHWAFLSGVTSGAAVWVTHFLAMLGYRPGVPVSFDGTLTVVSAIIAVFGISVGLMLANTSKRPSAIVFGGGTIGLAIGAMHFIGMFAYRVDGIVAWDWTYVVASLLLATVLSSWAIAAIRDVQRKPSLAFPAALFASAIVGLHFTGMAAFVVTPIAGVSQGADSEAFSAMGIAIAMVGLLIVGAGVSTHLLDRRAHHDSRAKLRHIALHDALTQIANRRGLTEELTRLCGSLGPGGAPFALLAVDLDRFKPINDTLGHPIGDKVLQRIAGRLKSAVGERDLVARSGGDEFAIIAKKAVTRELAMELANRIVELVSRPIVIEGNVCELSASVGITLAPEHGARAQLLASNADIAMYQAKRNGKGQARFFDLSFTAELQRRRHLEADLRRACMREDFAIAYQPVFDPVEGRYTGAEALLRWTCAKRGEVPPSEFIPIAEELGLVSRIGAGVLRQACREAVTWPENLTLSVNLSPVQLMDPRLTNTVSQALGEAGLAADRLELEITETALLANDDAVMQTLTQLRGLGVSISLDDFGTGYSSLSYLHRFPINRIKIDKSFVQRLPDDEGSMSIVRAISQLSDSLDLQVTAEGIESEEQLSCLVAQGCKNVQGFLISEPMTGMEIAGLFAVPVRRHSA